jgi:hypothetical protein
MVMGFPSDEPAGTMANGHSGVKGKRAGGARYSMLDTGYSIKADAVPSVWSSVIEYQESSIEHRAALPNACILS